MRFLNIFCVRSCGEEVSMYVGFRVNLYFTEILEEVLFFRVFSFGFVFGL